MNEKLMMMIGQLIQAYHRYGFGKWAMACVTEIWQQQVTGEIFLALMILCAYGQLKEKVSEI